MIFSPPFWMFCTLSFPSVLTSFKCQAFPFPPSVLYSFFPPFCKSAHLFEIIIFSPLFCFTETKRKRRRVIWQTKGLALNRSRPDAVKNTTLVVCLQHSLNLTEFKTSDIQYTVPHITQCGKAISRSICFADTFCT